MLFIYTYHICKNSDLTLLFTLLLFNDKITHVQIERRAKTIMTVEPLYSDDTAPSVPSRSTVFLQGLITFLWWAAWAVLAVFIIVFLTASLALAGVEPLKNQLFTEINPVAVIVSSMSMIIGVGAFLIILKQLRAICQTLVIGDPFVPQNAQRLRIIWIAVAAAEVLRLLSGFFLSSLMTNGIAAQNNTVVSLDLRISVWFLVFAFIIFAEVFREGTRLRQEQKLTV